MDLLVAESYGVKWDSAISNRAEFLIDKDGILRWMNIERTPGDDTVTIVEILAEIDKVNSNGTGE